MVLGTKSHLSLVLRLPSRVSFFSSESPVSLLTVDCFLDVPIKLEQVLGQTLSGTKPWPAQLVVMVGPGGRGLGHG